MEHYNPVSILVWISKSGQTEPSVCLNHVRKACLEGTSFHSGCVRFRKMSAFFSPKLFSLCIAARQIFWEPLPDHHGCSILIERKPLGAACW